jgi:hypothetical protein
MKGRCRLPKRSTESGEDPRSRCSSDGIVPDEKDRSDQSPYLGRMPVQHTKGLRKFGRIRYPLSALERGIMRMGVLRRPPLPDFLGIGVPKAGTTWLYANLKSHPDIYLPEGKEIHYFDANWFQPLSWYGEVFAEAGEPVKGEITPAYCNLPARRIRSIKAIIPEIKLLLLLRDPVDRDWSHLRMVVLRDNARDPTTVTPGEYIDAARSNPRLERGNYQAILENWLDVFDRARLFIGFYEDVVQRPQPLLEQIFEHIGLSPPHPWEQLPTKLRVKHGIEASIPAPVYSFLVDRHQEAVAQLASIIGESRVAQWRQQWEKGLSGQVS